MITSHRQLLKVRARVDSLYKQLELPAKDGVPKQIEKMAKAQLRDSIESLEAEITEYHRACETNLNEIRINGYQDLMKVPIVIRLATRQTLMDFAGAIGISESQLKRYEANEYQNAPQGLLNSVLSKYNLSFAGVIGKQEKCDTL